MFLHKKAILIELFILILINIALMFVFIKMDLFERVHSFTRQFEPIQLDEMILLCITLLLSISYLFCRLWRSCVVYARVAKESASKDLLTKLLNRRTLEHTLATEWDRYARYHEDFCLVLFDIDDFSDINDGLGYLEGDRVLTEISKMLSNNTRKTDSVGRWGEEEFLILCPVCKAEQAVILAEKLRAKLYRTLRDGIELSASFAVVQSKPGQPLEELMKQLDFVLHKAKKRGKNCVLSG